MSEDMKIKKPSLKGMKNTEYLGHFKEDKYIQDGHNFSGGMLRDAVNAFAGNNRGIKTPAPARRPVAPPPGKGVAARPAPRPSVAPPARNQAQIMSMLSKKPRGI